MKVFNYLFKLLLVLLFFFCTQNRNSPEQPATETVELPKWASIVLEDQNFKEKYEFNFRINPFYLQADFDKDGFIDLAILIKARQSGKTGLAILQNGQNKTTVFGAGQFTSFGGDDWQWLRTWKTEPVLPAGAGIQPLGQTIILFPHNPELNAPWLFWNGKSWQWKAD